MSQDRKDTLPPAMSLLLSLAANDQAARSARRAAAWASGERADNVTAALPRPGLNSHGRIRHRSVLPVTPIMPLADRLSARRLLSRGQAVTMTACLTTVAGLLTLRLATGIGPSPLAWAQAAVAAVTVMYIVVVGFRLLLGADTCDAVLQQIGGI